MGLKRNVKNIFKRWIAKTKMLFDEIPYPFNFIPMVFNRLLWLVSYLRLDLWILTGEEVR